ncbi:MAG: GntR family transcriptional regulator [Hyphomicrobiales bacterium]
METTLERMRLSEQIEDAILNAIRKGEYAPGTKLPSERMLMEMFNVGRPSVKEALLMLERKGFVQLKRGVAPIVLEPTPRGAMDAIGDMVQAMLDDSSRRSEFYDLRVMLETYAAMEAARIHDEDDIEALAEALEACRAAKGLAKEFRDADQAFHHCVMATQQNSVAKALHGALIEWGLYNPEHGPGIESIHARVIAQHEAIFEAVRYSNAPAAAEAMRTHLLTRKDAPQPN